MGHAARPGAFGLSPEQAAQTEVLAARALYNGFSPPGLFWGWWLGSAGSPVKVFFLLCVLVAGLYGAATAHRRILWRAGGPGIGRARAGVAGVTAVSDPPNEP